MPRAQFDAAGLYAALDTERQSRGLTWKKVAGAAEVSASTLTRMAQGKRPDVDSLAALLSWAGLSAEVFIRRTDAPPAEADTLTKITAYLRADAELSPTSADAIEKVLRATYELVTRDEEGQVPQRIQDRS